MNPESRHDHIIGDEATLRPAYLTLEEEQVIWARCNGGLSWWRIGKLLGTDQYTAREIGRRIGAKFLPFKED